MVEVIKILVTSFKRSHACTAALSAPDCVPGHRCTNPCLLWRLLDAHQQVWVCLSLVGSLLLSPWSWCTEGFVCALQESVSPVLCKFWQLYGKVNGNLLHEGLCHIQVCCPQNPWPCGRPLLTHTSSGDTQTLRGRSGSVSVESPGVHDVLFEPSEHLWWVWGLILNMISPLLPFCWGFSSVLGHGIYFFLLDPTLSCQLLFSSEL